MEQPHPPTTPEMQALWNRAMLLTRTRGAYQVAFPVPETSYPMPAAGTLLHDLLFIATATDDEFEAHLSAVRNDMLEWRERVQEQPRRATKPVDLTGIDMSKVKITL